jgi:hypothetical protein
MLVCTHRYAGLHTSIPLAKQVIARENKKDLHDPNRCYIANSEIRGEKSTIFFLSSNKYS